MQSMQLCGSVARHILPRCANSTRAVCRFASTLPGAATPSPTTSAVVGKGWIGTLPPESVLQRKKIEGLQALKGRRESYIGQISPANEKVHAAILGGDVDAAEHLRSSINKSEDDIETIRICLHAEHGRLSRLPRAKRLALMAKEEKQLARTVLIRLGSDTAGLVELVRMLLKDERARFQLCYFAVAEGLGAWMQKFITANMAPILGPFDDLDMSYMRNALLRDLIGAHLSLDREHSADSSITCLFEVKASHFPRISYHSPGALLSNELSTGRFERTKVALWDKFTAWYKNYNMAKAMRDNTYRVTYEFRLAGMAARHPCTPRYDKVINFVRTHTTDASQTDLTLLRDRLSMRDVYRKLLFERVAILAENDGRVDDATWIRTKIPTLLSGKDADWQKVRQL